MKSIIGRKIRNYNNNSLNKNILGITFKNVRTIAGINEDLGDRMIEMVNKNIIFSARCYRIQTQFIRNS